MNTHFTFKRVRIMIKSTRVELGQIQLIGSTESL